MKKPTGKRDYKALFAANPLLAEAAAKPVPGPKRKYKRKFKNPVWLLMGEGERAIEMVRKWAEGTKYLRNEHTERRGPGRPEKKWHKVIVARAVAHLRREFPRLDVKKNFATQLPEIKNPTTGKSEPVPENICAIIAEGLRRAGVEVTDKDVENYYDRSRRRIVRYDTKKKLH
jgi:hypothetical protein